MEITLRMFYARAFGFVLFVLVMLFALAMLAAPAFAQEAVAPTQPDMIDLVFSSAAAAATSLLAVILAFVARILPKWAGPVFDLITTTEASRWEQYQDAALDRAEAWARTKFDALKDRNGYVNAVVTFLHAHNSDLLKYVDKNGNGVIDLLEARLPPVEPGKKTVAPHTLQTLMAATARRGVSKKTEPAH